MLLAGDVGGTKILLGLFERTAIRPTPVAVHTYPTSAFSAFSDVLDRFARDVPPACRIDAAGVGVAGPVIGTSATITNVGWAVDATEIGGKFGTSRVQLLNDLSALATSVDALTADELAVLQEGTPREGGNAVVIAAGTGLGEAYLRRVDGRLRPFASEGGHADFAARTDAEIELLRRLRAEHGRAEVEDVLSGSGLGTLYQFTHQGDDCEGARGLSPHELPAAVSRLALAGTCARCRDALSMFVAAYGAEAGNLGLRGMASAGVFVGGGIAPKILPALQDGTFMDAFRAKGVMADLVAAMPVKVILNSEAGLLGAAIAAAEQ